MQEKPLLYWTEVSAMMEVSREFVINGLKMSV